MPDPVLVVAADLHFAKLIERACASEGLECISADEGESALVALEFEKPIAVIVENDLRDRMGTDLCKEIRSRPEGEVLPIILLAGPMMPAAELTARAVKVGVTCCLDSSVPAEHIAMGLRALLEGDDSILARLVNGEPLDAANEPTHLDDPEPSLAGRKPDRRDTRVRESDDDPPRGSAPVETSIEVEIDDSIITGARIKAPPPVAKAKHPPAKPRNGTLSTIPFAKLLSELRQEFATGALELSREKVKKTIWISDGVPVSAKSNAMGETLGAVLVKMGKLTETQRAESVEKMQKEKRRHGEVLVEMGICKQKDVNSALQAQARAKVINCFAWDDGAFDFKPAEKLPTDQPELKMSFGALIAAGVKQRYDLPRLRKVLLPHIGETPRFREDLAEVFAELKLEEAEKKVVEALKGRRSLAEVLALSDMDELELHRVLVTTAFAGVVQFSPEGNVTRQYRLEQGSEPSQIGKSKPEPERSKSERTREPSVDLRDVESEKTNVQEDPPDVFGEKEAGVDLGAELGRELRSELEDNEGPTRAVTPPAKKANGREREKEKGKEKVVAKAAPRAPVPKDPAKEDTGPKPREDDSQPEATEPPETRTDPEVEAKINAALTRMRGQNHYERLGVAPEALPASIKAAYLRLAKEYHPDRLVQDGGAGIKSKADELFAMIADAYHVLTDDSKRKKYDDEVLRGIKEDASDEANAILNAEHQFLKGERLLKAGNIAKAFEAFAQAIELYPKESEYQACYGWTMFKMAHPGDMPRANEGEKVIRNALTMNARNDKAHLFLGQIALLKGNTDEARKHFDKALEIQPDNIEAQRELRVLDMRASKKGISGIFGGGRKK